MSRLLKILSPFNLPKRICVALLGEKQHIVHRMAVGLVFMISGVTIAHVGADLTFFILRGATDMFGYMIHGIGCTPFLEFLIKISEEEEL